MNYCVYVATYIYDLLLLQLFLLLAFKNKTMYLNIAYRKMPVQNDNAVTPRACCACCQKSASCYIHSPILALCRGTILILVSKILAFCSFLICTSFVQILIYTKAILVSFNLN